MKLNESQGMHQIYIPNVEHEKILQSIEDAFEAGNNKLLISMSTGSGKSIIAAYYAASYISSHPGSMVLFLSRSHSTRQFMEYSSSLTIDSDNESDKTDHTTYSNSIQTRAYSDLSTSVTSSPIVNNGPYDLVICDDLDSIEESDPVLDRLSDIIGNSKSLVLGFMRTNSDTTPNFLIDFLCIN